MINRRQFAGFGVSAASLGVASCAAPVFDPIPPGQFPSNTSRETNRTADLNRWVSEAILAGKPEVLLPPGELHFWPEGCSERILHISNNDDALNLIVLLLDGVSDFHIRGQNTKLIFHGRVTPFVFQNCRNVRLSGVEIDWLVPFHCEALVKQVSSNGDAIELEIGREFRYRVENNQFFFVGEGFEQEGIKNILEFDTELRETRFGVWDNFFKWRTGAYRRSYELEVLPNQRLKMSFPDGLRSIPKVGNTLVIMPPDRLAPAIFVEDSERIEIENIVIHHAGCMGLICQTSTDISFVKSKVVPSGNRYVSTTVDATHFVNCAGSIVVEDCEFSNHIDDAVNVHGIYVRIAEILSPDRAYVEYVDHQQRGVKTLRAKDYVTISDANTVEAYASNTVKAVEYLSPQFANVTFERELTARVQAGDVINVMSRQAHLILKNNSISKNRARGVLISTAGHVVVEGNRFHTPGSAIRISGGVDFWYESGPTSAVLIRNNVFDHCKYGVWGDSIIDAVCVDSERPKSSIPYHEWIAVIDNEFVVHHENLLKAYRLDTLVFRRNKIRSEPYLQKAAPGSATINLELVDRPLISDNFVADQTTLKIQKE